MGYCKSKKSQCIQSSETSAWHVSHSSLTVDIITVVICLSCRVLLQGQVTVLLIGVFIMKPKKQLRAESSNCPLRKRNL